MILVTGATGTVGREVVRALRERGAPVRAAVRRPDAYAGGDAVRFDFGAPETFPAAFAGVEGLFLLRPPALARAEAFRPALEAAKSAGVRHVAFLSVRGADKTRLLPHHAIEALVAGSGIPFTQLRPNDFMQNFATVHAADIRERDEIWAPAGEGRASYVDVRDVADAAAMVLMSPGPHAGRAYTLTGPEALAVADVARLLSAALGRAIVDRKPGALRFVFEKVRRGTPLPLALVMTTVYSIQRFGLAAPVSPDLGTLLGRDPTPFADFARDHRDVWARPGSGDATAG